MAEIYYLQSFTGTTERDFAHSFEGINYVSGPLEIFLQGYIKAYQKEYEGTYVKQYSGDYIKHYHKQYIGEYTKEYLGEYTHQYLKQYEKHYEKSWSTNWDKAYVGQWDRLWEGSFDKQYEGFFTGYFTGYYTGPQYYNSKTVGNFNKQWEGSFTGYFARGGVGVYSRLWEGQFDRTWIGVYTKQYEGDFIGYFTGYFSKQYSKEYISTYEKQYTQTWQGFVDTTRTSAVNYDVQVVEQWTHTWVGQWEKHYQGDFVRQWSHQYLKHYQKEYERSWLGEYTHQWEGEYSRLFHHNYVGYYTGYFSKQWLKQYEASYHKSNYDKVYIGGETNYLGVINWLPFWYPPVEENFAGGTGVSYTKNYDDGKNYDSGNAYEKTYTDVWVGSWDNELDQQFGIAGFARSFLSSWSDSDIYAAQYTEGYTKASGYGTANYDGSPAYLKSYVSPIYTKVTVESEPGGPYIIFYRDFGGRPFVRSYSSGPAVNYVGVYSKQWVKLYATQWSGTQFQGINTYQKSYETFTTFTGPSNYESWVWINPPSPGEPGDGKPTFYSGSPANWSRAIQYTKGWISGQYTRQWTKEYEAIYEQDFVGYTGVQYEGTFIGQFDRNYEGSFDRQYLKLYQKEYDHQYEAVYINYFSHLWEGAYDKQYEGIYDTLRNSTETYQGGYLQGFDGAQYTKEYDGLHYIKQYTKEYEGIYDKIFNKQFSHNYEGQFQTQYTGQYEKLYLSQWEGVYLKQWEAVYEGGPFNIVYSGIYDKIFNKNFTKTYIGQYENVYEGVYNKQYNSADFLAYYTTQYTKEYEKLYIGNYEHVYVGVYEAEYSKGYIQQYNKEYDGIYVKSYEKSYGGAWLGAGAKESYVNTTAHFGNSYAGTRTFHQTFEGTTTDINSRSGNLTEDGGLIRVKENGKLKPVERLRVKEDDIWKTVQTTRIKENGIWKIVGVDYDRVDIDITSNTANFNLGTELNNLGFTSLYNKPKHVNITIANNVHVYSTSSTPAFDTSLVTNVGEVEHKVKILLRNGSKIIGAAGQPGTQTASTRTGADGTNGGDAILLRNGVSLFIESYGTIAGGGGGGGSGGYPISGSTASQVGGLGGHGAGWDTTLGYISDSDSDRNGINGPVNYSVHGGNGGLLGQLGVGAGGFVDDDGSKSQTNPGTNYSQYARSGNGGLPGSAIKGYNASRVTFINSTEGSVWGDSAFKFKA